MTAGIVLTTVITENEGAGFVVDILAVLGSERETCAMVARLEKSRVGCVRHKGSVPILEVRC